MKNLFPGMDALPDRQTETATFSMGCFWEPDALFGSVTGVLRTRVGYAGGATGNPSYDNLGDHSETVEMDYDPNEVSYEQLLRIFWTNHDPTFEPPTRQYASRIFFHNELQRRLALKTRSEMERKLRRPIRTVIMPATQFHLAEPYHQKYRLQNIPEIMNEFRERYPDMVDFLQSTAAARVNGYLDGRGTEVRLRQDLPMLGLSQKAQERLIEIVSNKQSVSKA